MAQWQFIQVLLNIRVKSSYHDLYKTYSCSCPRRKKESMSRGVTPLILKHRHLSDVSGQLHAPTALTPRKNPGTHKLDTHFSPVDNRQRPGNSVLVQYWSPVSFPPTAGKCRASQGKHQYFVNCQGDISSCKYEWLSYTPVVKTAWQLFTWLLVQMNNNRRICQKHQPWELFLLRWPLTHNLQRSTKRVIVYSASGS
jgi:hypothetical protein